jgi:peptidoglycan/LPS O-acetylase OafA/YrhL
MLILNGASLHRLYRAPDTHSEGLLLGAGLAFLRRAGFQAGEWAGKLGLALVIPPLIVGAWKIGLPIFEVGAVLLAAAAVGSTDIARGLSVRPLVWLGRLSYSLYLWHFAVLWAVGINRPLLALPIALVCAWLSYRFIEQPFRRRRAESPADVAAPATKPLAESLAATAR